VPPAGKRSCRTCARRGAVSTVSTKCLTGPSISTCVGGCSSTDYLVWTETLRRVACLVRTRTLGVGNGSGSKIAAEHYCGPTNGTAAGVGNGLVTGPARRASVRQGSARSGRPSPPPKLLRGRHGAPAHCHAMVSFRAPIQLHDRRRLTCATASHTTSLARLRC